MRPFRHTWLPPRLAALIAEGIGTFALVFIGCGAIASGGNLLEVALAFGVTLGVMVYALGHISGAHVNPAVSVGLAVGGHIRWRLVPAYVIVQAVGAIVAAGILRLTLASGAPLGVTRPSGSDGQAFVWETILTFFLVLVVTAVATDERAFRQAAGAAIGGTIVLDALAGGPISGASMNPARSLGPALVAGDFTGLWIYLTAPFLGAILAALAYRLMRGDSSTPDLSGGLPEK